MSDILPVAEADSSIIKKTRKSISAGGDKKRKEVPFVLDPNFFVKNSKICPQKIRATSIAYIVKHPPPFKLNLGSETDLKLPPKFDENTPYIFRLPEKIRVKIFKYISSAERTQSVQLVCRLFSKEIRLRVGVRAFIHDRTTNGVTFMRDVIVDTVIVGRFTSPYYAPKNLFIRPRNVKDLTFVAPISIQHLDAFLLRCNRITKLTFQSHIVGHLVPSTPTLSICRGYQWRAITTIVKYPAQVWRLKKLTVTLFSADRAIDALPLLFQAIRPKNLKCLCVRVEGGLQMAETTSVHLKILIFLAPLRQVTHLMISTEQKDAIVLKQHQYMGLSQRLISTLSRLRFRELILTEHSVAFHTWILIMINQRRLRVFQVLHLMLWSIPNIVITNNQATLRKVAFHVVLWTTKETHEPIDLAVFRKCVNLQELFICASKAPKNSCQADLTNFFKLPKSVKTLLLKNCTIFWADIAKITKKLRNLQVLGVMNANKFRLKDFGVKSGSIRKLLRMRCLNELFISSYEIRDVKGMWGTRAKTVNVLKMIGATVKGKKSVVHFHGKNCRWFKVGGKFTCLLHNEWTTSSN